MLILKIFLVFIYNEINLGLHIIKMIVKRITGLLLIVLFSFSLSAQNKDAILGKWLNADSEAQIMIYKTGSKYSGKLVWIQDKGGNKGLLKLDSKNPKPELRNRPLLGIEILHGFVYQGDGIWEEGFIYDPKTGKTYNCKISMASSDQLYIRGYVGISLLGRTETWQRAS